MAAEEPTRPPLVNPMVLWADLSLRALESSVSTSQKIGDTVDRMTRASAAAEPQDASESAAGSGGVADASGLAPVSPLALVTRMHRSAFDTMQQGWLQWMSMVGTLATATARRGLTPTATGLGQEQAAASIAAIESPVDAAPLQSKSSASTPQGATQGRRETHANSRHTEHAHAAAEAPKRRARAGTKRKSALRDS